RGESAGCFPTTAPSRILTPAPRTVPGWTMALGCTNVSSGVISRTALRVRPERLGQAFERADDAQPVDRFRMIAGAASHELEESPDLEPERLVGRDLGAVDVTRAGRPFAVALGGLPRSLFVHRDLALELHVVEDGHLLLSDDGHLPHLVRIEPREVHVRDLPRREPQVAEHDVLDAGLQECSSESN